MKLYKKLIVSGKLELKTGLHIGDSKETTDIGGVDSPVIRRKDNNQPYIPGSSLKGKIRSLLEISYGKENTFREPNHPVGKLFGALGISGNSGVPSRLIVRDAYLTVESADLLSHSEFTDMPYSEVKFENVINRIEGKAEHPRQIERVPAGSIFDVSFVINVVGESEEDAQKNEADFLQLFYAGIKLLEDDYLGGSGSRGYGQVKLSLQEPLIKTVNEYLGKHA
jgi:CRISPR-associated protein Csm3